MDGTHEGAVAAVGQGRHYQAGAVAQVLVPILHLSIHHAHWDAQVLRVVVQVLAAVQTVRQRKGRGQKGRQKDKLSKIRDRCGPDQQAWLLLTHVRYTRHMMYSESVQSVSTAFERLPGRYLPVHPEL